MLDLSTVPHHRSVQEISEVLCNRTRKDDPVFFRILTTYYLGSIAACMRAKVNGVDGEIPLNNYVIALAPSGFGKGKSTYALEQNITADFRNTFRDHVLPNRAEQNMWKLASRRAAISGTDDQTEYDKLNEEFVKCGEYEFVFDGGSEPAIKQIRQLLLLADCGSINYQVDEIGTNLEKAATQEAMAVYLELYDQGMIKNKLTKNSSDNKRTKPIEGKTPSNMLLFGTPTKLLDSGPTEKRFESLLETGYARRCLFAFGDPSTSMDLNLTPEEIYDRRASPKNDAQINAWANHLAKLADPSKLNWTIDIPRSVGIELVSYQQSCEQQASELPEHAEIQKHELQHRYFKALKVAGIYAFVDESLVLTRDHLLSAIKLVEESGAAFQKMLRRESAYAKLARYIATSGRELTHADLDELPYYKGSQRDRQDLMTMAASWGYKHHIVLKKHFIENIEFFTGETIEETDLSKMLVSYSNDYAYNYGMDHAAFDQLHLMTQAPGIHWCNHAFEGGHRHDDNVIPGFNLIVLDIDGGIPMQTVHDLLEDYMFLTYTTKRHTPDTNRFRLIMPSSYNLKLEKEDYREFMTNLMNWLPIPNNALDSASLQRSKKWASHDAGTFHYNLNGNPLDVLPFIPKTSKNEQHQQKVTELGSLDNLERWFAQQFAEGNRNNQMARYAFALVDAGFSYNEIEGKVIAFNGKLSNGLTPDELRSTVLKSVAQKLSKQP